MNILFKLIVKSIFEKKMRTFLITFTVIIATALFFASTALPNTLEEMIIHNYRKYVGSSEIVITPGDDSRAPFFRWYGANRGRVEYAITSIDTMALHEGDDYELTNIKLLGMDLEDVQKFNPYTLKDGNPESLGSNEIIVGQNFSEKHNLMLNSTLELNIFGEYHVMRVAGIAEPTGPFMEDGGTIHFIASPNLIRSVYGLTDNYVSTVYIKSSSNIDSLSLKNDLSSMYRDQSVGDSIHKMILILQLTLSKCPLILF